MTTLLLALACINLDQDGDGVQVGRDCDDNDPRVGVGPETCFDGGLDRDCSGDPDDAEVIWFVDQDHDGVGRPGAGVPGDCHGPSNPLPNVGYVLGEWLWMSTDLDGDADNATATWCAQDFPAQPGLDGCWLNVEGQAIADDCDDSDPSIHPGAQEACDEVDRDCDGTPGLTDQGVSMGYTDADRDGWGDPSDPLGEYDCAPPRGVSLSPTDCDDGSALVQPMDHEACGDGAAGACGQRYDDSDMDRLWHAACADCHPSADGVRDLSDQSDWIVAGDASASALITRVTAEHPDLGWEIGRLSAWIDDGTPATGGARATCEASPIDLLDSQTFEQIGLTELGREGVAVGDGVLYVRVGTSIWAAQAAPWADEGMHRVYESGADPVLEDVTSAPVWSQGVVAGSMAQAEGGEIGPVVHRAGGATWFGDDIGADDGFGQVIAADDTELVTASWTTLHGLDGASAGATGTLAAASCPGDQMAASLSVSDGTVVFGRHSVVAGCPDQNGVAQVFLLNGGSFDAVAEWTGQLPDGDLGAAVATGDVDGDGVADALLGEPGKPNTGALGRAYLVRDLSAPPPTLADADRTFAGRSAGDHAGSSVALVDLDGDGYDDAAIGLAGNANGRGAVAVLYGPVHDDPLYDAPLWLEAPTFDGQLGAGLVGVQTLPDGAGGVQQQGGLVMVAPGANGGDGAIYLIPGWLP